MSKPLDERVKKILKELEFNPKECLWECHGTWVMYHRYVEIAGVKNNVGWRLYEVEANSKDGYVAIRCEAEMKKDNNIVFITTFGEASIKNYRVKSEKIPYYPYAMAEKRAVDRAILKLIGLHGFIYSEDELDHTNTNGIKKGTGVHSATALLAEENTEDEKNLAKDIAEKVKFLIDDGFCWKAYDLAHNTDNEVKTGVFAELNGVESKEKGKNGKNLLYTGILRKYHQAQENGERPTTGDL